MTLSSLRTIRSWAAAARLPLKVARLPITLCETPPGDTSPAVIASLTHNGPPWKASLADLIHRGLLQVEDKDGLQLRVIWPASDSPIAGKPQLTPYEQILLEAIFQDKDHAPLAAVAPRLAWRATQLESALENELIASSWLDEDRRRQREQRLALSAQSGLIGAAVLAAGLALAAGVSAQPWIALASLLVAGGIAGVALSAITLRLGLAFSELSAEGERAAVQWKGYALHLRRVWQSSTSASDLVETHLPLAMALGLAKDLSQVYTAPHHPPLPVWFKALASLREQGDWGAQLASVTLGGNDELHEEFTLTPRK